MNVFHDIGMHVKSNKEKASLKCAAGKVSTVKRSEDLSNKEYVLFCSVLFCGHPMKIRLPELPSVLYLFCSS